MQMRPLEPPPAPRETHLAGLLCHAGPSRTPARSAALPLLILLPAALGACSVLEEGLPRPHTIGRAATGTPAARAAADADRARAFLEGLAGAWDGIFQEQGSGAVRPARLAIDGDAHLFMGGRGTMRLVPEGVQGSSFVYRGEVGGASSARVSLRHQPNRDDLSVHVQWDTGEVPPRLTVARPGELDSAFGSFVGDPQYFAYRDWRAVGGTDDPATMLGWVMEDLHAAGWVCLQRVSVPVRPGQPTTRVFEQTWPGSLIFMIYAAEPDPNLAYWIGRQGGVEFRLLRAPQNLPFPAFGGRSVTMGTVRPTVTFTVRDDDPRVLSAGGPADGGEVEVLVFGPSRDRTVSGSC